MMMLARFIICQRGAAAAEMALILPLAVLMIFSALEAGHYLYQEHQVTKGLRDSGRWAARQSFDLINCRGGSASAIPTDTQTAIKNLARTGKLSGGTARIAGWDSADITIEVDCPPPLPGETDHTGIYDSGEPAARVTISTNFSYNSLFDGLGVLTDSVSLSGSHQATVMGI
ncbi:TadE/TadG family type IV pilus assembly protein [Altererythrobacter litoralis]|uniref:TadE/TadG family type IV pilus assembly protein n=1 Tax=Altererythrobacter litoralis TaxID=3113904 RepID=A0ABU7GDV8_9SPHN|nr:TadE/TadG family type IV pilus assembly protein [Erythrobacteraceae bacterium 1XM1-14]